VLASRLLGYCLEHALIHLVGGEDAMLTDVLFEHTLVRLSGEDAMFTGVLPEHALVHVDIGEDAMFAGVLPEHALVHVESGEDAMFGGVLPKHALVHVESGEDAMLAGMLPENALVHLVSGEDMMHLLVNEQGVLLEHALPLVADEGEPLYHTVLRVASERALLAAVEGVLNLGDVGDSVLFPGRGAIHFGNGYVRRWVLCPYGSFELQYQ
jgi:hypothetical protein